MSETTLTPVVIASLVGATFATLGTVATLYLAGYFTQPINTAQPDNGRVALKERGRSSSARNRNNGSNDQGNGRRSSPWRRNGSPAPRQYDPIGRDDQLDSHSPAFGTPGHLDQHNLQGPRRHGNSNMDETPLYGINGAQRSQRPSSSLSMPQSGPLGSSISPNSAMNAGQSPLHQQPISPHKPMHPISTKPPKQMSSPRNKNNSQTVLPHVTTSRPGSPIAGASHTGIHVTSRTAQQDGSQGPSGNTGLTTVRQTGARSRGEMIEAEAVSESFHRVIASESTMTEEEESVCHQLIQALDLRWKWWFRPKRLPEHDTTDVQVAVPSELDEHHPWTYNPLPKSHLTFKMVDGVIRVFEPPVDTTPPQHQSEGPEAVTPPSNPGNQSSQSQSLGVEVFPLPGTDKDFFTDLLHLGRLSSAGPVLSYCHHRLTLLEQKFNLHSMLNASKETLAQKTAPHRDFYNVRKIDTHVHHSACMHQKHLLRFIKSKLKREPDEIVIFRDGKFLTLQEVFESLNLTAYDLNVDTLDMHADKTIFHRFDRFNLKYNPFGQSRLREVFIKQDNLLHGRFLAELTKEVFTDLEETKYQHTEYRISIYGRKTVEWDILAAWVCQNGLYSDKNVWLIQVPRLYNVYKAQGLLDNFEQMLNNLFEPLFEVTADPSSHPQLHIFLQQVVGFDCVDDESKPERRPTKSMPKPAEWDNKYNAAYSYYIYYLYANLYTLNSFRQSRGLNTFTFRPHCGEAGELDHLASAFMCCDNIAHGINLRKSPMLQYLFYLAQIGLCMSPLSNNSLFLDYHKNPFPQYFARGLSVSLSTDDPLQIHLTKEPLVEEYSVAANMWKFSSTDLCEIARNSVLHSGFPHECKKHWLSSTYWKPGPLGNDIQKTNVPNLRMRFRYEVHQEEMRLLYLGTVEHTLQGSAALRLD